MEVTQHTRIKSDDGVLKGLEVWDIKENHPNTREEQKHKKCDTEEIEDVLWHATDYDEKRTNSSGDMQKVDNFEPYGSNKNGEVNLLGRAHIELSNS